MPELVTAWPMLLFWVVAGYLLGSVPFGVVVSRAMGLGDLRKIGSGNIGTTNVLRTGSKTAALATLLLDGGKGALAVVIARFFAAEDAAQLAAAAAFAGHCFPVWLRGKGGKGVATYLGVMLALWWPAGLLACATWVAVALSMRISSLSALVAAALGPVFLWLTGYPGAVLLALVLAAIIYWRHAANIARLMAGTEPRIGKR